MRHFADWTQRSCAAVDHALWDAMIGDTRNNRPCINTNTDCKLPVRRDKSRTACRCSPRWPAAYGYLQFKRLKAYRSEVRGLRC